MLALKLSTLGYSALGTAIDREDAIVLVSNMGIKRRIAKVGFAAATKVISVVY